MVVIINQGHAPNGNPDPGACNGVTGLRESDITFKLGNMLAAYLGAAGIDARTIQSDSLSEICDVSNLTRADAFISIHCNSCDNDSAEGFEIYTTPGETAADPLATAMYEQVHKTFPDMVFRIDSADGDPDKEANFYVLRNTDAPAVLIECGFISNMQEQANMQNDAWCDKMAAAWARGITDWAQAQAQA